MKKELLVFDMDGTLADFYNEPNWFEDLQAHRTTPYENARPLVDMKKLVDMLNKIKDRVDIAIVTWGSKEYDKDFQKATAKAKKAWLDKYEFPYDIFRCTKYGESKRYPVSPKTKVNAKKQIPEKQILFDDNPEVREDWKKWHEKAIPENEMLDFIAGLVAEVEKENESPELYLVLDCETATLPFIKEWDLTPQDKQKISIAKPLIYDIGWQVVDKYKKVYSRHSYLIQETFFVPNVFNTAYYAWKRPLYMERYKKGEITCVLWEQAMIALEKDLKKVKYATAYNAMFDFKKAIPFTDYYIANLYNATYQDWEEKQKKSCEKILNGVKPSNPDFDNMNFELRSISYPIADIWGLACSKLINKDDYRFMCLREGMISQSGLYFKTSAEASFRYLVNDTSFEEEHTAISDTEIETDILCQILHKGEIEQGIEYFPFEQLGKTVPFMIEHKEKITYEMFETVAKLLNDKIDELETKFFNYDKEPPFLISIRKQWEKLNFAFPNYFYIPN